MKTKNICKNSIFSRLSVVENAARCGRVASRAHSTEQDPAFPVTHRARRQATGLVAHLGSDLSASRRVPRGGALLAWDSYSFIAKAERTTGEVVQVYSWESWNPWDGETTDYSPVFRYLFSDGNPTEASTGQSSPNWNHEIGSKHNILFDPTIKTDVKQDNFEQLWALPVTIGAIGMVLLIPALIAAWFLLRWLRGGNPKDRQCVSSPHSPALRRRSPAHKSLRSCYRYVSAPFTGSGPGSVTAPDTAPSWPPTCKPTP